MKKAVVVLLILTVLTGAFFAAQVKRGGVITIAPTLFGQHVYNFNPFLWRGYAARGFIYETLFYVNPYNGKITPWLAKSYEWRNGNKSLIVDLRENVEWSDGKKFTADDVVFTFNLLKKYPALDRSSVWNGGLSNVKKLSEYKIEFDYSKVNVPAIVDISNVYIVPKHIWIDVENPVKFVNKNPVGTGPFLLDTFSPAVFTLKRNPNYWQKGKPYIDEVRVPSFTGNDSANLALVKGELDWAGLFIPNIQKTYVAKDPENNHYWFPQGNLVGLFLNNTEKPFDNPLIRKAIAMAINKEMLVKIAMYGYTTPANDVAIKSPGFDYLIDQELKPLWYSYDPKKAVSILESLGYKKGSDGIFEKDGEKLSFNLLVVTGWTDWITVSQLISRQLKTIGIDANVTTLSFGAYLSNIREGKYDMAISWATAGSNPFFLYDNMLNTSNMRGSNREKYSNLVTDAVLAAYRETAVKEEERDALNMLQLVMLEQVPAVPLFFNPTWFEYSTKRFVGWPSPKNPYAYPETMGMGKGIILANIHLK